MSHLATHSTSHTIGFRTDASCKFAFQKVKASGVTPRTEWEQEVPGSPCGQVDSWRLCVPNQCLAQECLWSKTHHSLYHKDFEKWKGKTFANSNTYSWGGKFAFIVYENKAFGEWKKEWRHSFSHFPVEFSSYCRKKWNW